MAGHILQLQRERPANIALVNCTGARRWHKKVEEAKEDMAGYFQKRPGRDVCQLAWSPQDRQ